MWPRTSQGTAGRSRKHWPTWTRRTGAASSSPVHNLRVDVAGSAVVYRRPGVDISEYRHQESIEISCSPEQLYDLVADVSRMGQWSPVCTGGSYDEDGAWFTGTNAMGEARWETRCRVVAADPGRKFAFINHGLEGRVEMVR